MVAMAAARACVSAPWVVERRKTRSCGWRSPPRSMISPPPGEGSSEKPLAIALPKVERSGTIPWTFCAPPTSQRNPVIISSSMQHRSMLGRRAGGLPARKPGSGATLVSASSTTQAIWPGCARKSCSRLAASLYRNFTVRSRTACGMPAVIGRGADEPVVRRKEGLVGADGDQVPPRVGARKLDSGRRGVGAVLGELHHVHGRHTAEELLGAGHLERTRPHEVGPMGKLPLHRLDDGREGMTQPDGAEPHPVLDEFIAIHVPDVTAMAPRDEGRSDHGILVVALRVGVGAARDQRVGPLPEVLRTGRNRWKPGVGDESAVGRHGSLRILCARLGRAANHDLEYRRGLTGPTSTGSLTVAW